MDIEDEPAAFYQKELKGGRASGISKKNPIF